MCLTPDAGDIITVFVAHLKSKRPIVPDELRHSATAKAVGHALSLIHRAAESAALRCLVVDDIRKNNRPVVVLGDLNDTVHSVTTEIVSGTQPWCALASRSVRVVQVSVQHVCECVSV